LQEKRIQHTGKDGFYTVRFDVRLDQPGTHTLAVSARPVAGETRTDNNSRPVAVNVAPDKAKVLLVDGEARWEFHYLANALLRDRTMQPTIVLFQPPLLEENLSDEDLQRLGNPRRNLPAEADALNSFACIVLGDVPPAHLPVAERQRLNQYVADHGGTLVIAAGKRFMPSAYTSHGPGSIRMEAGARSKGDDDTDPLEKLFPIQEPRTLKPV